MDLAFTPEQDELAAQARSFLDETPEPTWAQLTELGWTGASIAEDQGGAGLGLVEEGVLHEEPGRALYHGPFWSTLPPPASWRSSSEVAAGEASWTFANGPLVPDLDTAQRRRGRGRRDLRARRFRARGARDARRDTTARGRQRWRARRRPARPRPSRAPRARWILALEASASADARSSWRSTTWGRGSVRSDRGRTRRSRIRSRSPTSSSSSRDRSPLDGLGRRARRARRGGDGCRGEDRGSRGGRRCL